MVAYSFQDRFAAPILAGTKRQTIRDQRKRHARPGERLQLYTGLRTSHCRLITDDVICRAVMPVQLGIEAGWVASGRRFEGARLLDAFARLDGFTGWDDLTAFWRKHHPCVPVFSGVLIRWHPELTRDNWASVGLGSHAA